MVVHRIALLFVVISLWAVPLRAGPQRLVCLAPSVTEMVYALKAGDRVVGVSRFSNYPLEAASKKKVGPFTNPNIEKIVALNPDLVIGLKGANPAWVFERLKQLHIRYLILKNGGIASIFSNMLLLGQALGQKTLAQKLVFQLKSQIVYLKRQTAKCFHPKVFLQLSLRPLFSCGRGSYLNELIQLAGGRNITSSMSVPYPIVDLETVIAANPDIILIALPPKEFKAALKFWQRFKLIKAVKLHQIYQIDPDLFDRPSPRIVRALTVLTCLLHPKLSLCQKENR